MPVSFEGRAPAPGADIRVGEIAIGAWGPASAAGASRRVRTDRAAEAAALGAPPIADGVHLALALA